MKCNVALISMHEYFVGELSQVEIAELKNHLQGCADCCNRFEQLEKTDAAIYRTLEAIKPAAQYDAAASKELTERIISQLPKKASGQRNRFVRFIYRYPGFAVAAMFLLVMIGSFFMSWTEDTKLIVSGEDLQNIIIEGNTVIVPEGVHYTGNLTVENGIIEVLGEVEGNVTVVDGSMVLASTGHIAGQSRTIDQALDWFWYKVTQTFSGIAP